MTSDEYPFGCPYPDCTATFETITGADNHVDIVHADERLEDRL